jgi:hypothetical protein
MTKEGVGRTGENGVGNGCGRGADGGADGGIKKKRTRGRTGADGR